MTRTTLLRVTVLTLCALSGAPPRVSAQSLRGSSASLTRQNAQAHEHDFSYLQTPREVNAFVEQGRLVRLRSNADVTLASGVSFPYARPEVRTFVERLGAQYRSACGEKLVVTSLTRPLSGQPANASDRSVHPTGMALDLRRSNVRKCRGWLEETLLALEDRGVLEATRENRPPHYHVAVYPAPYRRYVASLGGGSGGTTRLASASSKATSASAAKKSAQVSASVAEAERTASAEYRVNRGDTLWGIARRLGTTVEALQEANNLRSGRIVSGQVLTIPAR